VDIREFIGARLDEDEATALAAAEADPAPWTAEATDERDTQYRSDHGFGAVIAADDVPLRDNEGSSTLCMTAPTARHVVAHNPARVLRDVAAKRATLKRHARCGSGLGWCDEGGHGIPPEFGGCFDLRELALVDEGHADFSSLWKRDDREA
jgi:hypothetical protein